MLHYVPFCNTSHFPTRLAANKTVNEIAIKRTESIVNMFAQQLLCEMLYSIIYCDIADSKEPGRMMYEIDA